MRWTKAEADRAAWAFDALSMAVYREMKEGAPNLSPVPVMVEGVISPDRNIFLLEIRGQRSDGGPEREMKRWFKSADLAKEYFERGCREKGATVEWDSNQEGHLIGTVAMQMMLPPLRPSEREIEL